MNPLIELLDADHKFNLESMYGSTEELFFVNWDLGGPYWKTAEIQKDYDRFSRTPECSNDRIELGDSKNRDQKDRKNRFHPNCFLIQRNKDHGLTRCA